MQSTIRNFMLATAVVAVASLTPAVHAQIADTTRIQVPFGFDYGNQHFYPGTYTLTMENQSVLLLSGRDDGAFVMVQRQVDMHGTPAGYVIFRKYGDRYFFAEYHPAETATTMTTRPSSKERNLVHELATRETDAGRVRLALLGNETPVPAGR
ncbi:MAG: hypothetical protein WBD46_08140 [Acidobacteriaceae bacterium]